uniref:ORF 1; putative n=1 Tax=Pseudomonas aeruginosa TaxID=287 RepID=Q8VVL9_PSEAI|nr:ORF 1; putative [Pseudomonas aeruginosa PAO1]
MRTQVAPSPMAASRSSLMPMDRVSRPRFRSSSSSRRRANAACCAARSAVGSGMAIRPRNRRLGSCFTASARAGRSSGAQPDLLASPLTLTCRQTFRGGSPAGRCSDRRCAIFNRSTECTHWKCSAMGRVLFDWMGPMKCQFKGRSASSACLPRASCR